MKSRFKLMALIATVVPIPFLVPGPALAQDRYHPFQQEVDYRIEAAHDGDTHVLTGRARLRYVNRAPGAIERLYFHQYLNAFRPNSAWADYDLRFETRTFQDLGPEEHAFERIRSFAVNGHVVDPVYPFSPDSTVFYVELPDPLEGGDRIEAEIDWTARLATEPRRQGRAGRHYNWAHWYPRIAFYGADGWEYRPHIRPGELNGTFARYDVTLDVPADQILGATGVPVTGDPGWELAAVAESHPPRYLRDHYERMGADAQPSWPEGEPLGLLDDSAARDRKRVRWQAQDVHNFAWSMAHDYRYLGGRWEGTPIHILWRPSSRRWDARRVLEEQKVALDWVAELFGEYAWPQITITDRVEGGATEYPMLYMTSGGAVVHETMHMVAHGILANNEWREGWLDEGMASFLTAWLREERGGPAAQVWPGGEELARLDRAGDSEPVGLPGAEFASYRMYSTMTYRKGSLVLRMLRDMLGEETFREGLRGYYDHHRFKPVTADDFQSAMERVSGADLEWFFDQWIDSTAWLDYRVGDVELAGEPGRYTLRVEVIREGPAWMPVVVEAGGERTVADSRSRRQTISLTLGERPVTVILDPDGSLMDPDRANNRKAIR